MESGAPMPPPHAPPARRAAVPDSAQRALRPMSRPAGYPASGPSPLAALALSMQPGVRSSSRGASSSIPNASMREEASSPRAILSTRAGVRNPSAPLGSEFTCDMSSAQSAAVSWSNLAPAPLGSSFLISTWFFSHALFCWLCRGSQ